MLTSIHEHDPNNDRSGDRGCDPGCEGTLSRPEREELLRDAVLGCPISPDEGRVLTLLSHFDEDTLVPLIGLFDRVRWVGLEPRRRHSTDSPTDSSIVLVAGIDPTDPTGADGAGGMVGDRLGGVGGWTEEQRRHARSGVGILTAWLAEPDGRGEMASGHIEALMTESGGAQVGVVVWGLINVAGHLLARTAHAERSTSSQVLQELAIACAQ